MLGEDANAQYEVLLWVGCAGALNERNKSVTRALAELLLRAGVKFAVLGREEKCTGDPAKRIGHDMLFQQLAMQNIATLDSLWREESPHRLPALLQHAAQ